ncbi:DnaJ-domain-containing protein [Aaosphaeria arxii CBS 175.79]|uniref:DnaJ-domain-containing protein n=1 Tax=Aaosphaeria arxii CBS 175.79 TaxID=1450172 RepID=A0A6A5XYW4_9PLEO|nr:DnaJ-domain-containing protein [Aaosphaeria arxii CBS 175.79]KAF2018083.1 DnaJ-domain-containing protein [Aaosphaeria arxii CBS 175.79]
MFRGHCYLGTEIIERNMQLQSLSPIDTTVNCNPFSWRNKMSTHYDVLSVGRDASAQDIRKAWMALSTQNHPDKTRSLPPEERARREGILKTVNNSYEVLGDPSKRKTYDASLYWSPENPTIPKSPSRPSKPENPNTIRHQDDKGWNVEITIPNRYRVHSGGVHIFNSLVSNNCLLVIVSLPFNEGFDPEKATVNSKDFIIRVFDSPNHWHVAINTEFQIRRESGATLNVRFTPIPRPENDHRQYPGEDWHVDVDHSIRAPKDAALVITRMRFQTNQPDGNDGIAADDLRKQLEFDRPGIKIVDLEDRDRIFHSKVQGTHASLIVAAGYRL